MTSLPSSSKYLRLGFSLRLFELVPLEDMCLLVRRPMALGLRELFVLFAFDPEEERGPANASLLLPVDDFLAMDGGFGVTAPSPILVCFSVSLAGLFALPLLCGVYSVCVLCCVWFWLGNQLTPPISTTWVQIQDSDVFFFSIVNFFFQSQNNNAHTPFRSTHPCASTVCFRLCCCLCCERLVCLFAET